jgi:hypothetical protein
MYLQTIWLQRSSFAACWQASGIPSYPALHPSTFCGGLVNRTVLFDAVVWRGLWRLLVRSSNDDIGLRLLAWNRRVGWDISPVRGVLAQGFAARRSRTPSLMA